MGENRDCRIPGASGRPHRGRAQERWRDGRGDNPHDRQQRPGHDGLGEPRDDALVWALTDLLVEPMKNYAFYEVTRQRVEEMRQQNSKAEPPQIVYARGSVEWQRQQEQSAGEP